MAAFWDDPNIGQAVTEHAPAAETIVAAALRIPVAEDWRTQEWQGQRMYPDYLTVSAPPPARHHTLMHPLSDNLSGRIGPDNQGFLTSTGRYVDRAEALQMVIANNQPRKTPMIDLLSATALFSEDLW